MKTRFRLLAAAQAIGAVASGLAAVACAPAGELEEAAPQPSGMGQASGGARMGSATSSAGGGAAGAASTAGGTSGKGGAGGAGSPAPAGAASADAAQPSAPAPSGPATSWTTFDVRPHDGSRFTPRASTGAADAGAAAGVGFALTIRGSGFSSENGMRAFAALLVVGDETVVRQESGTVSNGTFTFTWPAVMAPGRSYFVVVFVDTVGNGVCDPVDDGGDLVFDVPVPGGVVTADRTVDIPKTTKRSQFSCGKVN